MHWLPLSKQSFIAQRGKPRQERTLLAHISEIPLYPRGLSSAEYKCVESSPEGEREK
jgi:hypothetical protein